VAGEWTDACPLRRECPLPDLVLGVIWLRCDKLMTVGA
jgi:hypothetical protein